MQRGLYLSAMRMALVSVLPERAMLSGANFNTTDSTKLGGSVAKANSLLPPQAAPSRGSTRPRQTPSWHLSTP